MSEELELYDDNYEELLAEQRHKELLAAFTKLGASIMDKSSNKDVVEAVSKLGKSIEQFVLQSKVEPVVNVETNQDAVVSSVGDMGVKILKGLNDLRDMLGKPEVKKKWECNVTRDRHGYIDKLTLVQI
jgi:hypothetical protein